MCLRRTRCIVDVSDCQGSFRIATCTVALSSKMPSISRCNSRAWKLIWFDRGRSSPDRFFVDEFLNYTRSSFLIHFFSPFFTTHLYNFWIRILLVLYFTSFLTKLRLVNLKLVIWLYKTISLKSHSLSNSFVFHFWMWFFIGNELVRITEFGFKPTGALYPIKFIGFSCLA